MVYSTPLIKARYSEESDHDYQSNFDPNSNTARILPGSSEFYPTQGCTLTSGYGGVDYDLGGSIAHELIGHGGGVAYNGVASDGKTAVYFENQYHDAQVPPQARRCPNSDRSPH
jgi:hypothetical protein